VSLILGKTVIRCNECKDTGKLEIRNAYDPDYLEYEDCPYCKAYRYLLEKSDK
jgi:Zn finger protein HypA/HybF involved in hydrogenase expression